MIKADLQQRGDAIKAEELRKEYDFKTGDRILPKTVATAESDLDLWIRYQAYVENNGWQSVRMWTTSMGENNVTAGTTGQSLRMEAVRINCIVSGLQYRAHVQNIGWQNYVQDFQDAGTTGQSLRMEALEIVPPGNYHVYYRSHVENLPSPDDWLPWVHGWSEYLGYVKGSAYTGTVGESRRMEAIQCKIYQY